MSTTENTFVAVGFGWLSGPHSVVVVSFPSGQLGVSPKAARVLATQLVLTADYLENSDDAAEQADEPEAQS